MAQTERIRSVVNRSRGAARSGMTPNQIKYFGTPRQKAALKQRGKKQHRSNSSGSHRKKVKAKKNVGEIVGIMLPRGVVNSAKKGRLKKMATSKKNAVKKAPAKTNRKKARKNGGKVIVKTNAAATHRKKSRRNSGDSMTSLTGLATIGLGTVGGAVGSKLLTQMALGTRNEGLFGYMGNAAVGAALWWATLKISKNRVLSNAVLGGTAAQIFLRLINDYTPFGQYVTGLGIGDYQAQAFVTPQVLAAPMNNADISIPNGWGQGAPPMLAAAPDPHPMAAGTGMGSLYSGQSCLY